MNSNCFRYNVIYNNSNNNTCAEREQHFMPTGLVLEGGGMRGWYTAGVLTTFTENNISFENVYGISAGAFNALPFISGQNTSEFVRTMINVVNDERLVSSENLKRTGSVFGFDFLYNELLPNSLHFDYKTFFESPVQLKSGTTDLKTGKPVFFEKADMDRQFTAVRASCSLPMISNIVHYRGCDLLDGGYSAPIPAEYAFSDGNEKNVIVFTREAGYRKGPEPEFSREKLNEKYSRYPAFVENVLHRSELYNHELDVCTDYEKEDKAFLIRPSAPIRIGRCENDPKRLMEVYNLGLRDAQTLLPKLKEFLT